eukprot:gene6111-6349_t
MRRGGSGHRRLLEVAAAELFGRVRRRMAAELEAAQVGASGVSAAGSWQEECYTVLRRGLATGGCRCTTVLGFSAENGR